MNISSSYAKILGETNFSLKRFPEVGQKQKTEREKMRRERLNDGDNSGQATHGARKPPGPKSLDYGSDPSLWMTSYEQQ